MTTSLIAAGVLTGLFAVRWVVIPRLSGELVGEGTARLVDRLGYPIGFGSGSTWLAVRGVSPERVAQALDLHDRRLCGWPEGIEAGHQGQIFVSPRVEGWSLVVGSGLSLGDRGDALAALSRRVDAEVHLYTVDPARARFAWGQARRGHLLRAFEWDAGEALLDQGPPTPAERELGLWPRARDDWDLDPARVLELARRWSLDPQTLGTIDVDLGFGWVASGYGRQRLGLPCEPAA